MDTLTQFGGVVGGGDFSVHYRYAQVFLIECLRSGTAKNVQASRASYMFFVILLSLMQWEQLPCQGHLGRLGPGSQAGMQAIWDATSLGVERTDISPPKNIQTPNDKVLQKVQNVWQGCTYHRNLWACLVKTSVSQCWYGPSSPEGGVRQVQVHKGRRVASHIRNGCFLEPC